MYMYFRFLALDDSNNVVRGTIYANNETEAQLDIKNNGLELKLLQEIHTTHDKKKGFFHKLYLFFQKKSFSKKWKQSFFQQMYVLLNSGISIEKTLQIIGSGYARASKEYLVCIGLLKNIQAGKALSGAMTYFKSEFSSTEINVIRAAERVGRPQEAIQKLYDFSQNISAIKRKIVLATIYPFIVLIVAFLVITVLSTIVIPQFQGLFFSQSQQRLPLLTNAVIKFCEFFREHIKLLLFSPLIVFIGCYICPDKIISRVKGAVLDKIPILNGIVSDYNLYLFTSTLSMLLFCNIPLQDSMCIAKNVIPSIKIKTKIEHAIEKMHYGDLLSRVLYNVLSPFVLGMVIAGEQTGNLKDSFLNISKTYHNSVLMKLSVLSSLIEPLLIILVAVIVGIVIIAIFLPMTNLVQNINI